MTGIGIREHGLFQCELYEFWPGRFRCQQRGEVNSSAASPRQVQLALKFVY